MDADDDEATPVAQLSKAPTLPQFFSKSESSSGKGLAPTVPKASLKIEPAAADQAPPVRHCWFCNCAEFADGLHTELQVCSKKRWHIQVHEMFEFANDVL